MRTITHTLLFTALISFGSLFSNDFNEQSKAKNVKSIKSIEYGILDGKTGKNAVYVYFKNKAENGFDFKKDRVTIFCENLPMLKRTLEYKKYVQK